MTYQNLFITMCYSVWLLHVFFYIQRVGMLILMTPPPPLSRRDVEPYYRETNSHFYIPFSRGDEAYSYYIIHRQYQCTLIFY